MRVCLLLEYSSTIRVLFEGEDDVYSDGILATTPFRAFISRSNPGGA
jgi:hypothetical protein